MRYLRSVDDRLATSEEEGIVDESTDEGTEEWRHDGTPDPVLTA